jgi:hypothetical protein
VVQDDAVVVVDDLGLAAELDGLAEAALRDGTGVGIMQRHEAGGAIGGGAGDAELGLRRDAFDPGGCGLECINRRTGPAGGCGARSGEAASSVADHRPGLGRGPFGDADHVGVDGPHLVFGHVGASS